MTSPAASAVEVNSRAFAVTASVNGRISLASTTLVADSASTRRKSAAVKDAAPSVRTAANAVASSTLVRCRATKTFHADLRSLAAFVSGRRGIQSTRTRMLLEREGERERSKATRVLTQTQSQTDSIEFYPKFCPLFDANERNRTSETLRSSQDPVMS